MIELTEKTICPDCLQVLRVFANRAENGRYIFLVELCKHKLEIIEQLEQLKRVKE